MSDKLPPKILVVEPDEHMNANICNMIERYWFNVIRAKDYETALKEAEINLPNVAIISSRIQGQSAKEMSVALKKIPHLKELPVIFLMEPDEPISNYNVTDGFSEVLVRPFTLNELMTLIRSLLRKSNPIFQDKVIKYNDISMDLSTFQVTRGNKVVHLGPTEFKILQLFVQKPKNIYSRAEIIDHVWNSNSKDISLRTIDVHINRIRILMKLDTDRYPLIKTIRSRGYCLD